MQDINHLSEINKTLSNVIKAIREKGLFLVNKNASYQKEVVTNT